MSHVLITRAADRSRDLIARLASAGIAVQAIAVTEQRVLPATPSPITLSEISWVAFTSARAVEVFSDLLSADDEMAVSKCRIAAVGSATAQAVRHELGRDAELIAAGHGGSDLAQALIARIKPSSIILFPCAAETAGTFESELQQHKIKCVCWPLYETVAVAANDIIKNIGTPSEISAALFYVPSAAYSLAAALPPPWTFKAIAIGEATARALHETGIADVSISESPSIEHIFVAIKSALQASEFRQSKSQHGRPSAIVK